MNGHFDRLAPEYDDWWLRTGRHGGDPDEDAWHAEVAQLVELLGSLAPRRTLDVACGTGFLTRHLPGDVTGLDASGPMLDQARAQAPAAKFVQGDALDLPFADGAFERVFTSFFYGHLDPRGRERFLTEARRVGDELVVVEGARDGGHGPRSGQHGSGPRHDFAADELSGELGARVLHAGRYFVVVTAGERAG